MDTKVCTKCGEVKALSEFYKQKGCKDGVRPDCKACVKAIVRTRNSSSSRKAEIKAYKEKYYAEPQNKEKQKIHAKEYREDAERRKARVAYDKKYFSDPEKVAAKRIYKKEYDATHKEQIRQRTELSRNSINASRRELRASDPKYKLSMNMSRGMRSSLTQGSKAGRSWETLVDYTIDDLRAHLEGLFQSGMTWENQGSEWHIDHRTPQSVFNFTKPEHIDFGRCWALSNLQPMWAKENIVKSAKLTEPFQPSLGF